MVTETRLKIVLLAGLAISTAAAVFAWRTLPEGVWIYWLIWPAMLLHQCEENVLAPLILGPRFGFLRWLRTVGYDISPARALALNVLVGWTLAVASGLAAERFVLLPLFVSAVEGVNGFWHLSVTAQWRRWSPGTLTGALVAIPLAFWLMHAALSADLVTPGTGLVLFLLAALSHHCFLTSLPRTPAAEN